MTMITLNGSILEARDGERLVDVVNAAGIELPQVCYHPQLGPIQTCDTCLVEVDGKLVRACAVAIADGMKVITNTPHASAAQRQAFDRILENHMLYCTVCDNNTGNWTIHNTTKMLAVEHQEIPFKPKPFGTTPFPVTDWSRFKSTGSRSELYGPIHFTQRSPSRSAHRAADPVAGCPRGACQGVAGCVPGPAGPA